MPVVTLSDSMQLSGTARVWTRLRWADTWTEVNLIPTSIGFAMLPEPSIAELEWDFGRVMGDAAQSLSTQTRQTWLGRYVKIEQATADGTILWIGFIDSQTDQRDGIDTTGPSPIAYGRQQLTAFDMAQALRHEPLLTSYYCSAADNNKVLKLDSPIAFNADGRKNRSAAKKTSTDHPSVNSSYVFSDDEETAEYWRTRDMIEYLLAWHSPRKPNGQIGIPFVCPDLAIIPDTEIRTIPTEGARLADVIYELIDRRVTLGCYITYDAANNRNLLQLCSTSDVSVQGVPANSQTIDLVAWRDPATKVSVTKQATNLIHQVVARGNPRITIADIKTKKAWSPDDETAYFEGASTEPGYSSKPYEKIEQNKKIREKMPLRNVFRRLLIDKAQKLMTDDEEPVEFNPYRPLLGILSETPLDPEEDYESVTTKDRIESGDRRKNLAYVELKYNLSVLGNLNNDRTPAYQELSHYTPVVVNYDPEAKFIDVNARGNPQHKFSTTVQPTLDVDTKFDDTTNLTDLRFTLPLTDGRYAQGLFPSTVSDRDQVRRIVVDFPGYDLVEILEETVVGLKNAGVEVFESEGGFAVDGRPELRKLAERAAKWFCQPRSVVRVSTPRITTTISLGKMLATIDAETAMEEQPKSIITQITIQLPRSFDSDAPEPWLEFSTAVTQLSAESFSDSSS